MKQIVVFCKLVITNAENPLKSTWFNMTKGENTKTKSNKAV